MMPGPHESLPDPIQHQAEETVTTEPCRTLLPTWALKMVTICAGNT
jgi:hypothetical protein